MLDGEVTREAIADLLRPTSDDDPAAQTMLAAYDRWLAADGNAPERAIVDLLGLFDRPADAASVEALRRAPAIPNLTDNLVKLAEGRWLRALRRLERIGLLLPTADGSLDAHPLVRTHAAARLESTRPAVWRAGNVRLYKHLTQTAEHRPNTVEGLMPLYQAVVHGCRAGRVQDAYDAVYRERIHRGGEVYSIHKLGLFGSELTVMSAFFEVPFARVHPSLRRLARADLMNDVGFVLRALGRLDESEAPMRASLEQSVEAENWTAAARSAGNLCILHVTLGALDQALADAKRSVVLADRSGATFERTTGRTGLANAHHQRGEMTSALALFEDAEAMQAEREPSTLPLYSLQGYWYCDLLLADGDVSSARAVIERAEYALEVSTRNSWALAIGLDNLSLARAWTILAHRNIAESPDASQQAQTYLDRAVEGLRTAGHDWILPHGLLARATFSRLVDRDASAADADLQEVEDLADRSGMRLFACDAHLERARLLRDLSTANDARDRARTHVAAAKKLIEETGYHRRDRELANLEAWLDENEPPHDLGAWS
ncbi:MAG: tetratricopeptide repeat protein [Acidobacteriota bacterium]